MGRILRSGLLAALLLAPTIARAGDPGAGRNYSATLRMDGPDRLKLRGYLGLRILGRTTNWIRVRDELQCNESA